MVLNLSKLSLHLWVWASSASLASLVVLYVFGMALARIGSMSYIDLLAVHCIAVAFKKEESPVTEIQACLKESPVN